jgi:hypothetical protein
MNNQKFDNVNVKYGFTLKVHMQSINITIMIIQTIHLNVHFA